MMNMSYCRFENTYLALREALGDVIECLDGEAEHPKSETEISYFRRIVRMMHEFLCENDLLTDDNDLDEEALEFIIKYLKDGKERCGNRELS